MDMIDITLVGGIPAPLKTMTSSIGMMKVPTEGNNQIDVPNQSLDLSID